MIFAGPRTETTESYIDNLLQLQMVNVEDVSAELLILSGFTIRSFSITVSSSSDQYQVINVDKISDVSIIQIAPIQSDSTYMVKVFGNDDVGQNGTDIAMQMINFTSQSLKPAIQSLTKLKNSTTTATTTEEDNLQSYMQAYMLSIDEKFADIIILAGPGIYSFQLWVYSSGGATQIIDVQKLGEDWGMKNITKLQPGTNYVVEVYGFDDYDYGMHGDTIATEEISFKTKGKKPIQTTTVEPTFEAVVNTTEVNPEKYMHVTIEQIGHNFTELVIFSGDAIWSFLIYVYDQENRDEFYIKPLEFEFEVGKSENLTWTEISPLQPGTKYSVGIYAFDDLDYGMHGNTIATQWINFETKDIF